MALLILVIIGSGNDLVPLGTKPLPEPMMTLSNGPLWTKLGGIWIKMKKNWTYLQNELAEWRSGSVSALPCERPGFTSRTRLREIIPANNCTMQEQNNWGHWGSPVVMKLWVVWEVLRWLMKFRELCSGSFHPKLVTPPYHGFLNVNTPPNSQNSKRH